MNAATYTQAEVLQLFNVAKDTLYKQPHIMACRVTARPVRYSKRRIDAILNGTDREQSVSGDVRVVVAR